MTDVLMLAGGVALLIVLLLGVIRYKSHQVTKARHRIHTLETHNQMLQQELNHANTRKDIEQDNRGLSNSAIDERLHDAGYLRD